MLLKRNSKLIIFFSVFLAMITAFTYFVPFFKKSFDISNDVLRLHIIANSDLSVDQNVKLKVRDAVLTAMSDKFLNSKSLDDTLNIANKNKEYIKTVANNELEKYGVEYGVNVEVKKEYFNTRSYNDVTLPAGCYNSVVITLGNGVGKNWWCVMYPAICLPQVSDTELDKVLDDDEMSVISNSKYDVRFKIVEVYEKVKSFFENKTMRMK